MRIWGSRPLSGDGSGNFHLPRHPSPVLLPTLCPPRSANASSLCGLIYVRRLPQSVKTTSLILALVLSAFAGTGCSNVQTTPATIAGGYTTRDDGKFAYPYSLLELNDDSWIWSDVTDALPGPKPTKGHLSLEGCLLTLGPPGKTTHYIVTQQRGRFLLWSPKDYAEYLRTGRVSKHVLYQNR